MSPPRRPRARKVASLTGSLLDRGSRDPEAGFVLVSLADKRPGQDDIGQDDIGPTDTAVPPLLDSEKCGPEPCGPEPAPGRAKEPDPVLPGPDGGERGIVPLTPQHVIEALRRGHKTRAEFILAELAGLTQNQARHALFRDGGRQLAVICRALGVEQLQFASIFILCGKLGSRREPLHARDLAEITAYFAKTNPERACVLLNEWQSGMIEILGKKAKQRG